MRVTVMSFSDLQTLKADLKALIIEAAERSNDPAGTG